MATSMIELEVPEATNIIVTDRALTIELADCRTLSVPLEWYPRLMQNQSMPPSKSGTTGNCTPR